MVSSAAGSVSSWGSGSGPVPIPRSQAEASRARSSAAARMSGVILSCDEGRNALKAAPALHAVVGGEGARLVRDGAHRAVAHRAGHGQRRRAEGRRAVGAELVAPVLSPAQ